LEGLVIVSGFLQSAKISEASSGSQGKFSKTFKAGNCECVVMQRLPKFLVGIETVGEHTPGFNEQAFMTGDFGDA